MLQLIHMKRKNKRKGMVSIEVISVKIIGKTKDKLITMDNEYINISDIKDIYKEKRN